MKLRRSKAAPTGRRRLNQPDEPKSFGKKFSYRAKRSDTELNIGRQVQREERSGSRHAKSLLRKTGLVILMLAIFVSVANILSLSTNAKVLPLEGNRSGSFLHTSSVYEKFASQELGSSIWNQNKITINTEAVTDKLVKQFPEISSASLTVPLLAHRPIIYIQPAKPTLVISTSNGAFVVADTGKSLIRANTPDELSKYKLPLLDDQSGLKLIVGNQALQSKDVEFIRTIITELKAKQISIESMSLPGASSELDVKIAGQPYLVKFNLQSDTARQQAGTYLAMIAYLQKQNTVPAKYVDVRVDGRAYYQ